MVPSSTFCKWAVYGEYDPTTICGTLPVTCGSPCYYNLLGTLTKKGKRIVFSFSVHGDSTLCVEGALQRVPLCKKRRAKTPFERAKDMKHAGNILIASLGRQPENTLLHWAGTWHRQRMNPKGVQLIYASNVNQFKGVLDTQAGGCRSRYAHPTGTRIFSVKSSQSCPLACLRGTRWAGEG